MLQKKPKILVVDDIERNRIICEEILEDRYRLAFAEDGIEAIKIVDKFEPDLILLDVMMPIMSGLDVCREIRASTRPWIKILMVSACVQTEDRLAGYEAGADDYICKPFDEDELLAKIHIHLKLKHTEDLDALKFNVLKVLQHGNRSPITKVLLQADTLKQFKDQMPDPAVACLQSIEKSAWQLHEWMAKAEHLVELKSGNISASPRPIDIRELVQGTFEELSLNDSPFDGCLSLVGNCKPILGDQELLQTMVTSLIRDALGRADHDAKIRVELKSIEDDRVALKVIYRSKVMTTVSLAKVFEPFGIEDDVLLNRGDGMSLAMAREIALTHGGNMTADLKRGQIEITATIPTSHVEPTMNLGSLSGNSG